MTQAKDRELIKTIMAHPELATELEKSHPGLQDQMTGYLLSFWLPQGLWRKVVMFALIVVAVVGTLTTGSLWYLLLLLVACMFSPRIVGILAVFIGNLRK